MFQGRALTKPLRTNTVLGSACVRYVVEIWYLDSNLDGTSKDGDGVFGNELFECN